MNFFFVVSLGESFDVINSVIGTVEFLSTSVPAFSFGPQRTILIVRNDNPLQFLLKLCQIVRNFSELQLLFHTA